MCIRDSVAAVVRREEVGRERFACYQPFRTFSLIPERYKQIVWTTSVRTSSWDPYASPKEPPSPTATCLLAATEARPQSSHGAPLANGPSQTRGAEVMRRPR